MAREIAHGEVVIGVDLDRVGAELAHAEAQFARSMANIDRMKGEAEASVKTTKLDAKIADAKRKLLTLNEMQAHPKIKLDDDEFEREVKKLQTQIRNLNQQKVEVGVDTKELRDANRLWRLGQQRQSAMAKETLRQQKAEEQLQATWRKGAAIQQQAIDMDRQRTVELEKLRMQYIKLHDQIEKGRKLEILDFLGDETARRNFARTRAELEQVGGKLRQLGDSESDLKKLARASDSVSTRLRSMVSSLGSIRVQMGFMSATLRQTAIGFTVLGPVVFGLLGQIVSLVGVLGTGLAGALAVSSAGLAGFGLTALGIGLIMKPLIGDLQDAMKASTAYNDAVRKYGRGSEQAATAQEKLNKTLGDVGPQTRMAFESIGSMSSRWSKLTSSSRPVFFDAMASGIQAINRLMPVFAQESTKAFSTAARESKRWFDMLSSPEATSGIQQIMSNFTSAFPALSGGFRDLTAMMGRISTSASKLLPELTNGFQNWARNLMQSVGSGAQLDAKIARLVDHMQQIGRFAQSAGRMLATFFNAGANEGANLLNTLTNIMNRWTTWMQSARGQEGLAEFFSQANQIGSQFMGTLASIGVAMFEFSAAFAPLTQGAIAFVHAISQVVAAIMGLAPARGILTTIGGALAGAFIVSRIAGAVVAIQALKTALMGLQVAGGISGAFAAMFNPLLALGALVGGAVAAFALLSGGSDQASSSMDRLADSVNMVNNAISSLAGIETEMATSGVQLAAARAAQTKAQLQYNRAVDKFGQNSKQAKDAELALSQATVYAQSAREQAASALDKYRNKVTTVNTKLADQARALQETIDTEREKAREDAQYPSRAKQYQEHLDKITEAEEALNRVKQKAIQWNQRAAQTELNAARAQQGHAKVIGGVGAAWKRLQTSLPDAGQKAIVKMVDPKDAAEAIRLTDKLSRFGKGGQAAKILVDTKNVDQALAKLKGLTRKSTTLVEAKVNKGKAEREIQSLGKGKTATINAKADTKSAQRDMSKLTGKQLVNRITIRANNADAMSKLNAVERKQLRTKLLHMKANPAAVNAAIALINGKKIPDKIAKFKAEAAEAENANKKVQGFRDKTVTATTKWAGESEMSAAQSAIAAIQSKTVTVTTNYVSNGSPGRAAGGPTAGAYVPMPAQEKRHAESANRAGTRQSQPGVYRRPTLLVGEENRREWVIAENPSYRGANERYLQDAAANFGYRLTPFDANAATGADFAKKRDGYVKKQSKKDKKGKPRAERHGGYSYDFIQSQISLLSDKSSNLETERTANIERNPDTDPGNINPALSKVLGPLYQIKNKWYDELAYNLKVRSNQAARAATRNAKSLRGKDGLNADFRVARKELMAIRDEKPKNDKERKSKDKRLRAAEKKFEKARTARDNARRKVNDRGDSAGALWRELQQVRNDRKALDNRIMAIKDNNKSRSEEPGGGSDTPFGVQLGALDKSRYDIWQEFAGNVLPGGASSPAGAIPGGPLGSPVSSGLPGAGGAAASVSSPSFYASAAGGGMPGAAAAGAGGGAAAGGGGNTTVNQNINISEPPPDPHSFSKQLGWEAAAMLG